jgi:1-acyl-sn-glycerol-3-phosphate acyltransferase
MKPITLRIFLWSLTRALYRVTVVSPDNVPGKGGALLVSNHISFVDMLLILAGTRRFVCFLPPLDVREHWAVKPCVRYFGVCRLSPESQLV